MDDRHIKLKDAIEVVRETVADEYIESTLELRLLDKSLTADVRENVKGEWIAQEDDYHHYWECSECGIGVGLDDIRNYCPNCGADMRGEEA